MKKETHAQTASRQTIPAHRKRSGDARSIAVLPGAAARAPTKQDRDARLQRAATKVQMPRRQTSITILKAALAFDRKTCAVLRGKSEQITGTRLARLCFSIRLVTTSGTAFGADTKLKKLTVRSGRRDDGRYEPADI